MSLMNVVLFTENGWMMIIEAATTPIINVAAPNLQEVVIKIFLNSIEIRNIPISSAYISSVSPPKSANAVNISGDPLPNARIYIKLSDEASVEDDEEWIKYNKII